MKRRLHALLGVFGRPAQAVDGDEPSWWKDFLDANRADWEKFKSAAAKGRPVLVATMTGGLNVVTVFESLVAIALTLRGAKVEFLLCDTVLPACLRALAQTIPPEEYAVAGASRTLCDACWAEGSRTLGALGLRVHRVSAWVTTEERTAASRLAAEIPFNEIAGYKVDGEAIGEHAMAGALRYFARGDLVGEPLGEAVLRRYFEASLLTRAALARLLAAGGHEVLVFNHGIYVPFGVIGEVARARSRRVVNWFVSYRKLTFLFSHDDTYHHTLMHEPPEHWENLPWTDERRRQIVDYLESRRRGTNDWVYFHDKPNEEVDRIVRDLGIDRGKPLVVALTNVIWDAQLHYPANAFDSILQWVEDTIVYFQGRPDLQLAIRIHPAELRGSVVSRQKMADFIHARFPDLPSNIIVVPPEHPASTYALAELANAALIYGTKMGVELTSIGIPVIVAGEAWIRNKGLTVDARSRAEYRALLEQLPFPSRLPPEMVERARKYAYHFFFRRMIPLHVTLREAEGKIPFALAAQSIQDLAPGKDPGLDAICRGILDHKPFIYDELQADDLS
jgi:hypothetical protein